MIKCPLCNKSKGLIMEQPDWHISRQNRVEIVCSCVNCEIHFVVLIKLSKAPDKVYDVEKWS